MAAKWRLFSFKITIVSMVCLSCGHTLALKFRVGIGVVIFPDRSGRPVRCRTEALIYTEIVSDRLAMRNSQGSVGRGVVSLCRKEDPYGRTLSVVIRVDRMLGPLHDSNQVHADESRVHL